jgi:two-component system LytT family response regulator/two-component system response regulator LytT
MVTLAEELEFVRNYLLIEQARFRRRLRFEMPAQGAGAEIRLPGLTLQPVVENAIRHGIAKRREGGMVKIGLERVDGGGSWVISVANQIAVIEDSPSFDEEIVFVPGHALANTRDRLALAFRGRATLEFFREGEGWVKGGAQTARIAGGFMIRALVVDDEDLPRIQLRNMLAELPDAELLEARDGVDALERIQEVHPDVVFLDIEMPGLDGFEVVEQLSRPPPIVSATAYDEYAVKAFEANAIDYVLKPVHPTRLQQTWERIRAALRQSTSASSQDLRKLLRETRPGAPVRLAAHRNKRIVLVPRRSVVWVGVEDRIVFLHTATDRYLIDRPIGEMEELLKSAGFVRINRSELVNLEHVLEMAPWTSGTWRISLTGGAELNVSRERVRQFKALVGL